MVRAFQFKGRNQSSIRICSSRKVSVEKPSTQKKWWSNTAIYRHIRSSQEADVSLYLNKDSKLSQLVQSVQSKLGLSGGT